MKHRDIGTDDPRVRVRPGRGSRPRTKVRPNYSQETLGQVIAVDRGRYRVQVLAAAAQKAAKGGRGSTEFAATGADTLPPVTAVKARELGRRGVVPGDLVRLTGDLTGRKDTLARIVLVEDRRTQLRRTTEDGEAKGNERVVVANADALVIVTALADPPPRPGFIDRCLVAAYDAGMEPILCLTKSDLGDPTEFLQQYEPLGIRAAVTTITPAGVTGIAAVQELVQGRWSVLVGHSGVGKSTLINELIPGAARSTGTVNIVTGRGRHTSTSAVALELAAGGWVVDTPGIRSFGLAHVQTEDLLRGFPDLAEVAQDCPRGCQHAEAEPECELDVWASEDQTRLARVASFRRLLASHQKGQ